MKEAEEEQIEECIKEHDPKGAFAKTKKERERNIRTQSKLTEDDTQMSQLIDRWETNSFQQKKTKW